uniref:Uncharacterized protein n=1 Tax=Arion vulgaris TaxID=1028688 RepID=A0A0B7A128_9EUPU
MSFALGHRDLTNLEMKDPDISQLVAQNQTLSAELAQCQADKDLFGLCGKNCKFLIQMSLRPYPL